MVPAGCGEDAWVEILNFPNRFDNLEGCPAVTMGSSDPDAEDP